ncbi:hypothetical protein Tco_1124223 [Tanacetum coccineum]|uniref:Reverse transcriptase domain-containing protein n=1 Tax=Tanacetum coccineum TaxID=301880 RepID=A0ABQ5J5L1_9ASTR
MRTRSQARRRRQPQVRQTSVESSNLEKPDNPPIVTMADNRTMAQLLEAPTEGYEDAISLFRKSPQITLRSSMVLLNLSQNKNQGQNLPTPNANIADMLSKLVTVIQCSTSFLNSSGTLLTQPKEDLKGITTRSGVTIQGPKAFNHDTEVTKDTMPPANNGSTEDVQPPVVSNSRLHPQLTQKIKKKTPLRCHETEQFAYVQTVNEFPQTLPSVHPTSCSGDENSFTYDNFVDDSPNVFNPPPQPSTYSYGYCRNNTYYGHDCSPHVPFTYNPEPCYTQDFNIPQNSQSFQQQYLCCTHCGGPHETFQCQQVIVYESCCENYGGPHETFQCDQLIFDEPYCENCGGPHMSFQCQPMNQNYYEPNPCYDSNSFGFDQFQPPQFPVIHQPIREKTHAELLAEERAANINTQPMQYSVVHQPPQEETSKEVLQAKDDLLKSIETFLKKFNRISFRETPKVLIQAWNKFSEIKHAQPEEVQELLNELLQDVQNISEELAEYTNTPNWNRPIVYYDDDDDEDYTIAITPVLPTEEPVNSLSMGDEHLDTIPATESDEVIKSSVEDLVPIPSESEGIPDKMCDVPFCNNPTPLEASKDQFEDFSDSNDDSTSSDDDSFSIDNIEYVEASPPDSEIVSLEVVEIIIPEVGGIDDDILLTIKDDILREKLSNVNLLIAKIEALKDNPTPSSNFRLVVAVPLLVLIILSQIMKPSITIILKRLVVAVPLLDISLSKYDSFIFDLSINPFPPADRSDFYHEEFADELAHIISPSEYDCFCFKIDPELGEFTMDGVGDIFPTREPRVHVPNVLPTHPTLHLDLDFILFSDSLFAYIVWIFLPFLTYPVAPLYLLSCGNEDIIFCPNLKLSFFMPDVFTEWIFHEVNVYHTNE